MEIAFFVIASIIIAICCYVLFSSRPIYSGLSFAGALFTQAIIYLMLGQEFIAVIQVLIYAGAIMVLFLFIVMLLGLDEDKTAPKINLDNLYFIVVAVLFCVILGTVSYQFSQEFSISLNKVQDPSLFSLDNVADTLFTKYFLPFEFLSLLLLLAIVGSILLAIKKTK